MGKGFRGDVIATSASSLSASTSSSSDEDVPKLGPGIGWSEESMFASGRGKDARGDGGGKTKELGTIRFEDELGGSLGGGINSVSIGGITFGFEVDAPSSDLDVFLGVAPARPFFELFPTV